MLSYILLISLGIFMAMSIYSGLKLIANVKPVQSCDEGTFMTIVDYQCQTGSFNITVKNNGRFSIDGILVSVGDSAVRAPVTPISAKNASNEGIDPGMYVFANASGRFALDPDQSTVSVFQPLSVNSIKTVARIRVQPFIFSENNDVVVCSDAVIVQNLDSCVINP